MGRQMSVRPARKHKEAVYEASDKMAASNCPYKPAAEEATLPEGTRFRYHEVERRIMEMIESGQYGVGDRLPSVRTLKTSMGVSLSTVTHAYMELERKGIIEARPRSGYFVSQPAAQLPVPSLRKVGVSAPEAISRASLINTVLELVGNRDMVALGCICPAENLLPVKALARISNEIMRFNPAAVLGYTNIQGSLEYRQAVAKRLQQTGLSARADDILTTLGALEGLHIALRCLTRPGDNVVIHSPTYFCFVQTLETLGLRAIELPSDPETGIDPADLEQVLKRYDVAACILSGNFNNPDGALMSDADKSEVVRLIDKYDSQLIEDDVSGDIHFTPVRPSPFKRFDTAGRVTLCSSFSKSIAPGYRAGYMLPGRLMKKAMEIKATINVCCTSHTQLVIAEYLNQGGVDRHLRKLRTAIERHMSTVRHHLAVNFPEGTEVTRPSGGSGLWVRLPERDGSAEGVGDGVRLFCQARDAGISIAPGSIFTSRDVFHNYIRLSCNGVWTEAMGEALKTLGTFAADMGSIGATRDL